MTSRLFAICFNSTHPLDLARFWSGVLGWESTDGRQEPGGAAELLPPDADGAGFRLRFLPGDVPKSGQNWAHFDLTSASPEQQRETVARALGLGGRHMDVGQLPEEGHVVLADPEGNEFCVIAAGNKFLADTGFIGALACDGTQEVGYFWSRALAWPLVWDQDEETAIQSPDGGTKITWGGPPVAPKTGTNRLHFELALPAGADLQAELDRLVSLGARRAEAGSEPDTDAGAGGGAEAGAGAFRVLMLDPDGNEFTVRRPR